MKRTLGFASALLLSTMVLAGGCRKQPTPMPWHQPVPVGAVAPGQFHTIPFGYNPSVSGWPGAVGDIVQNAGSTSAWVRNGTADTAWIVFPQTSIDGGSSGGGIAADGGVTAPLACNGDGGAACGTPSKPLAISPTAWGASPWGSKAQSFCQSKLTSINAFKDLQIGQSSNISAPSAGLVSGNIEGGGYGETGASWVSFTDSIFQAPQSGVYCAIARMKFPTITVGQAAYVGLVNGGNTHYIILVGDSTKSTTHWVLLVNGSVGSPATAPVLTATADTAMHDIGWIYDGTTLTIYVDGVAQSTTATALATYLIDADGPWSFKVNGSTALAPGNVIQEIVYGFHTTQFASGIGCVFPDGSVRQGACMFDEEFSSTSTLVATTSTPTANWVAEDNFYGNLQALAGGEPGCVASANATVSGGFLNLAFTAHSQSSCPVVTWNCTGPPYTTTACNGSSCATTYPCGHASTYDTSEVSATWKYKGGYAEWRAKMPGGTGPGGDITFWGSNCMSPKGFVDAFYNGPLFTSGTGPCNWPQPGSQEMDVANYSHANGVLDVTVYISDLTAPSIGNFFGIPYRGWRAATPTTSGFQQFIGNPTISDPSSNFHVYATDWRPPTVAQPIGYVAHLIDGQVVWQLYGPAVPKDFQSPAIWNADTVTVSLGTLPQTGQLDYFRLTCPDPSYGCQFVAHAV